MVVAIRSTLLKCGLLCLVLAVAIKPCVISFAERLWAKPPGSTSLLFAFERNGRVGFIDPSGRIVIPPRIVAPIADVGDFSEGLVAVDRRGYFDERGEWAIRQDYWSKAAFRDGTAAVITYNAGTNDPLAGVLISRAGEVIARAPTSQVGEFSEGLASFEARGKKGLREFGPGKFYYRDYPGLKGFIGRDGAVVIQASFADVGPFRNGLARAALDGYCHLALSDNGKEGSPTSGYPSDCGGAPEDAVSPCKVGFVDRDGAFKIQPVYESAQDFQEGLAAIRLGGKWGFIDREGREAIAPQFEQVQSFSEGYAGVLIGGRWGFVERNGVLKIPARFTEVEPFSDSLAVAWRGSQPIYIDRNGLIRIRGSFRDATSFSHGLAAVLLEGKHVAYINHSGKRIFDYYRH